VERGKRRGTPSTRWFDGGDLCLIPTSAQLAFNGLHSIKHREENKKEVRELDILVQDSVAL
jgi:hypothetical protein